MPSPFPGMDPYLERPSLWPDVHHELISQIRSALNPRLGPKYVASVETYVYISDDDDPGREVMIPNVLIDAVPKSMIGGKSRTTAAVQITEPEVITLLEEEIEVAFIAIKEPKSETLITVIEVLSPPNKVVGSAGRNAFMAKRREVFASEVNWVEIDLLRAGRPTALNATLRHSDYRIIVSRGIDHHHAKYWRVTVRQPLPVIGIPLKDKEPDVPLALGEVLDAAYLNAAYDRRVDYTQTPTPPLSPEDSRWANKLLRTKGLR